jgi:hypothetical protein
MALDLNNSYEEAQNKLKSLKTFSESKSSINNALKKTENQLQPNFDLSKYKLDSAELEKKIKKQVKSQFDQLLGLILANKGAGSSSAAFLINKFIKTIKKINVKLPDIILEEILKSLGCDLEQTYESGIPIYIKASSIDLFKILNEDPSTSAGKILYERGTYSAQNIPKTTNKMLWNLKSNENQYHSSLYNTDYLGFSTAPLFDIRYLQVNPVTNDITGWYEVILKDRPGGQPNKVSQFLLDYYKTIKFIDINCLIASLMEAIFGIVSIKLRFGTTTIDDSTKFGLIVQRILGLCFDEDQEISVSGQAKTPELDDTSESFFEMTNLDTSIIEQRTSQIKRGVVSFETCDNVELPVDSESIIDIIDEFTVSNSIDDLTKCLNQISLFLSNSPSWSIAFPFPDQLKITLDFNFVNKIPIAVASTILSPKVILGFLSMVLSLGLPYDQNLKGLSNFMKQNRELVKQIISKIGAEFIETLFNEIKKDIRVLVRSIITDILKDDQAVIYLMIEKLVQIASIVVSIVNDYRQCKSVIDSILQLLSLVPKLSKNTIPTPLLMFCPLLPGVSANRAFINNIENLQKLGLPTGTLPDGSPNLGLQSIFAQSKGMDKEVKENGKVEAVIKLPQPYGNVKVTGKLV